MNPETKRIFSGSNDARVPSTASGRPDSPQLVRAALDAIRPAPHLTVWRAGGI